MRELDASILMLTVLVVIVATSLVLVGESRVDIYLAISILVYFIYTSIDTRIRSRVNLRVLDIALLMVFILVVAYRIALILGFIS